MLSTDVLKAIAWALGGGFLLVSHMYFRKHWCIPTGGFRSTFQFLNPGACALWLYPTYWNKTRYRHCFYANSDFLLKETLVCQHPSTMLIRALGLTEAVWAALPGAGLSMLTVCIVFWGVLASAMSVSCHEMLNKCFMSKLFNFILVFPVKKKTLRVLSPGLGF